MPDCYARGLTMPDCCMPFMDANTTHIKLYIHVYTCIYIMYMYMLSVLRSEGRSHLGLLVGGAPGRGI